MTIRAIVFDIGGVLEITPATGWIEKWEETLQWATGEIHARLEGVWHAGAIGGISEAEVYQRVQTELDLSTAQLNAFVDDLWLEYLGTLNVELADYFQGLRPQFQTAILSNSFVGARKREQAHYQFEEICDFIIYSHEVGLSKPDPHIYTLTCKRLDLSPEEVIFLDDVEVMADAARASGLHGIIFKDNAQAMADIQACIEANR